MSFEVAQRRQTRFDIQEIMVNQMEKKINRKPFVYRIDGTNRLCVYHHKEPAATIVSILSERFGCEKAAPQMAYLILNNVLNPKELEKALAITDDYTQLCGGVLISTALTWRSSMTRLETIWLVSRLSNIGGLELLHPAHWRSVAVASERFAAPAYTQLAAKIEGIHRYGHLFDHLSLVNVLMICRASQKRA